MPGASLKLAFIHHAVVYRDPAANREALLRLNEEAAAAGARILLNPELAFSGYSFQSREDIRPVTLTIMDDTIQALRELAARRQVYLCCGLAERDPATDIFYNSALVLGPAGEIVCHYRKVNAETRWACPGAAHQENTFATPWGTVGLLICSDSYYGLQLRATVLRGARLVLIPANWPPLGLDPRELWRARALENGVYLAACNRTGEDRTLSFREAPSCCYDPEGRELLEATAPDSRIWFLTLPLANGRLPEQKCRAVLARRQVQHYGNIYLDLRLVDNLTEHYQLPPPGFLLLAGAAGFPEELDLHRQISSLTAAKPTTGAILVVLPLDAAFPEECGALAATCRVAFLGARTRPAGLVWATPAGVQCLPPLTSEPFLTLEYGPARLAVCRSEALLHPELALHLAKSGHDLAVVSSGPLPAEERLVLSLRCLEQIGLVLATPTEAKICLPPLGHQRWQEEKVAGPGICHLVLDTAVTRRKRFQDRVNFALLLRRDHHAL